MILFICRQASAGSGCQCEYQQSPSRCCTALALVLMLLFRTAVHALLSLSSCREHLQPVSSLTASGQQSGNSACRSNTENHRLLPSAVGPCTCAALVPWAAFAPLSLNTAVLQGCMVQTVYQHAGQSAMVLWPPAGWSASLLGRRSTGRLERWWGQVLLAESILA